MVYLNRSKLALSVVLYLYCSLLLADEAAVEEISPDQGFWSQFKDPQDGKFDASSYLLGNLAGFMPVPIFITEPAVDGGFGLAPIFFHKPKDDQMKPDENGKVILPNISVVAAGITGNDSWFAGAGHFRNWSKDKYRYRGWAGYADVNLDWYPSEDSGLLPNGIGFNVTGAMIDQTFFYRLAESEWFIGANWRYSETELSFDTLFPPGLLNTENTVSNVSLVALYENIDYQFSPRQGLTLELKAEYSRDSFGSDFHYEQYNWEFRQYFEFAEKWSLAWRFDGATISGSAPFYLEPFVKIQGIPAMRYRGPSAVTLEVRGGYDLTPRWTISAFGGGGRAAASFSDLGSASTHTAVGAGFRYLIARAMGMRVGVDVAKGPEGTYGYIVVGSAW